jgi:hypothetical protein
MYLVSLEIIIGFLKQCLFKLSLYSHNFGPGLLLFIIIIIIIGGAVLSP